MAELQDQMHQTRLKSLCRVCGCSLKHSRTVYDCDTHKDDLRAVFHTDIANDSTTIHPDQFCEKCKTVLTKSKKAATEGKVYMHSIKTHEWHSHDPSGCSICALPVGGRPKKLTKNRGRPTANSPHTLITHIKQCSPPSLLPVSMRSSRPPFVLSSSLGLRAEDVECSICSLLLDQPVQLSCGSVVCMECICRLAALHHYFTMPQYTVVKINLV